MVAKLDYQPPKWAKEQKKDLQLLRQSKGKDITLSNLQRILKEEEEFPEIRNYEELYTNLHLFSYGSNICAYLFHKATPHQDYNDTDQKNMMYDFSYGLLQLFAVQNSLPKCLCSLEHPYVQLLLGNFEKAVELLPLTLPVYNPMQPDKVLLSEEQQ